jgi:hypothetical protein
MLLNGNTVVNLPYSSSSALTRGCSAIAPLALFLGAHIRLGTVKLRRMPVVNDHLILISHSA